MATATKKKPTSKTARKPNPAASKAVASADTPKSGSDAIRRVLAEGTTKNAEIIKAVKEKFGLGVKLGLVNSIKVKANKGAKKTGKRGRPKGSNGVSAATRQSASSGLVALHAAAELVRASGGIDEAREVLEVIASLRA